MKIHLHPEETLLREGAAHLQRGMETVGGRLFLSDRRLPFRSHPFNDRTGATDISVGKVRRLHFCWTRFLNRVPVFPSALAVETACGFKVGVDRRAGT